MGRRVSHIRIRSISHSWRSSPRGCCNFGGSCEGRGELSQFGQLVSGADKVYQRDYPHRICQINPALHDDVEGETFVYCIRGKSGVVYV